MTPLQCERCGADLEAAYRTQAFTGQGQSHQIGPDGASIVLQLGGFIACGWNCLAVLAAQRAGSSADAAVRIVAERERQVTTEGYTPEHDASMPPGELGRAGVCYARGALDEYVTSAPPPEWPWDVEWWKPKSHQRDLIRAGALIAAEIDRDPARKPASSSERSG